MSHIHKAKTSLVLIYPIGQIPNHVKDAIFQLFVFFYFTQIQQIPAQYVGLGTLVIMLFDAISDPLMGWVSDNTKGWIARHFGRRHFYMLLGILPLAVSLYYLFTPPADLTLWQKWLWMVSLAVAVRTSLTLFMVPYLSLSAEITEDYQQRTTISSLRNLYGYVAYLALAFIAYVLYFQPNDQYTDGRFDPMQYSHLGATAGVFVLTAGLLAVIGTKHIIPQLPKAPKTHDTKWWHAYSDMYRALNLKNFRVLFLAFVAHAIMGGVSTSLLMHMATFFWGFSAGETSYFLVAVVIGVVIASILMPLLTKLFGKKTVFIMSILCFSICTIVPVGWRLSGHMPDDHNFVLTFVISFVVLANIFVSGVLITTYSMLADVVDEYDYQHGTRQEGMFFAAMSFGVKATFGIGVLISSLLLWLIRFPNDTKDMVIADMDPQVIFGLGIIAGPVVMAMSLTPLLFLPAYQLDKQQHQSILAGIKQRKGSTA